MNKDEYYMNIAMAVRKKANCMGRKVGAVIVASKSRNRVLLPDAMRSINQIR
jgi:deoxycytidylate deaminase